MRKRAGALLQDEKEGLGGASKQLQKETVIAGGVAPLVELLKDGGGYLEAHTYVLQSLSRMITDAISALMSL